MLESITQGAHVELVRPVDDETEVRAQAAQALRRAGDSGFAQKAEERFLRAI